MQNSHGRKIDASGKGYRSVINGILLTKNSRPDAKLNSALSTSLQERMKAKAQERQVKKKTK